MPSRIRKNDVVVVITGEDRGKTGKVLLVLPGREKILVEGLNYVWKHVRKSNQHPKGARIQKEAPMDVSNVRMICQSCDKPTRIGIKFLETGEKVRVCRYCKEAVMPAEEMKA